MKNEYPCKPQFYYIKVWCKGVFISRTCLHDVCFANSILSHDYAQHGYFCLVHVFRNVRGKSDIELA